MFVWRENEEEKRKEEKSVKKMGGFPPFGWSRGGAMYWLD